jgi:hypothetical protein
MFAPPGRSAEPVGAGGYHDIVRDCAEKALVATENLKENVLKRALEATEFAEAREACIETGARQGLVIVGGEAIDRRLPGIDVYPPGERGDVDFVTSRSSKLVAATLMNVLRSRGLPASIQPAIHDGTWTVRVHRRVVADITEVLPRELDVLLGRNPGARGGKRRRRGGARPRAALSAGPPAGPRAGEQWGRASGQPGGRTGDPPVAPVEYLKMSLHLELSRPTSHCKRWPKVYSRMRSLYEAFPPVATGVSETAPSPLAAAAAAAARATISGRRGQALLCGAAAALEILGRPPSGRTDVVVLSEDPSDTLCEAIAIANEAERLVGGRDVRGGTVLLTQGPSAQGLFLPAFSSVVDVSGEEIVRVYGSALPLSCTECGSLASADAILFLLYGEMLSLDLDPEGTAGVRSAASSLAAEMLAREDAGDCSGNWRRMVMG